MVVIAIVISLFGKRCLAHTVYVQDANTALLHFTPLLLVHYQYAVQNHTPVFSGKKNKKQKNKGAKDKVYNVALSLCKKGFLKPKGPFRSALLAL